MLSLAITTAQPSKLLPGVPPVARTLPGFDLTSWNGIFAPAATPRPVVDKLNAVAGGLLAKHGVRVVRCQDVTDRVYADEDARRADRPAPKKRSY